MWEPISVESGGGRCLHLGPLTLWIRHQADEWLLASETASSPEPQPAELLSQSDGVEPGPDLDWRRWVVTGESPIIELVPVMPDRAVVVRPEDAIQIHHNSKAVFFVSIPVWLRVYVGKNKASKLCEIPSTTLSNTWFGDPMSGELCYALRTRARRELENGQTQPHCAVCPVTLHNGSTEDMEFERLCLRVEHLRTYEGERHLWTNGLTVSYRGEEQVADLVYEDKAPTYETVGGTLADPRQPVNRNLLKRSFGNVRSFTGF